MSFVGEIKRRKVFQVAAVYAVVAWVLVQIVATIEEPLNLPEWFDTFVIVSLGIGFPIALILSWAFDVTPEGVVRDTGDSPQPGGRTIEFVLLGLVTIAFGALLYREFRPEAGPPPGSIAVLPFENLSPDPDNAFFADGIHDDLLTELGRIRSLNTISRSSVLAYRNTTKTMPQIGAELSVAYVVTATVSRAGDAFRINAQLHDVETNQIIWSQSYDENLTARDVFTIRSEIATQIATAVEAILSAEDRQRLAEFPTSNLDSLLTYFRARFELERRSSQSIQRSIELFNEAIELDQNYAQAHAGLADAYMVLSEYSPDADRVTAREESRGAAAKAYELNPELPEALISLAWSRMIHDYEWEAAEALFREAHSIEPRNIAALHWLSHLLSWKGDNNEAVEFAQRAANLEPTAAMRTNLSYINMDAGNFGLAIEQGNEVIREFPDFRSIHRILFVTQMRAGYYEEGAVNMVHWAESTQRDVAAAEEIGRRIVASRTKGEPADLDDELISRLNAGLQTLPQIYAFAGDADATLETLARAIDERAGSRSALSIRINPAYDFVREDPRFAELERRAGFE